MQKEDINQIFIRKVKKYFRFLIEEYAFQISDIQIEFYETSVVYRNDTTAVVVSLIQRQGGIFVDIMKMINNEIPEFPVFVTKNTKLVRFDLKDLLFLRNPSHKIERPHLDDLVFKPGKEKVIARILKQFADALKLYAKDVLGGDFSIFPKLETIVRKRIGTPK